MCISSLHAQSDAIVISSMPNQQLVDYIKTQINAGSAKSDIRKAVASAGWPLADIERAFAAAERPIAPAPAPIVRQPVQPAQPKAAAYAQPVQPQPQAKPLPVIHMHPPSMELLRSPWIWSSVVALVLVALAAAAYFMTPVGTMIDTYLYPAPPPIVVENPNLYTDPQNNFSFIYPEGKRPAPKAIWEEQIMGGELSTSTLPAGSMEIPGVAVVSKIPLADFATSSTSAIYNYTSCCSGTRYWLDAASSTWKAEGITATNGSGITAKPLTLQGTMANGQTEECSLKRQIGRYTTYRIVSGDEGVPTHYYYFLLTDKSYVLRFMTTVDLDAASTDPTVVQSFTSVISSLKLIDSAPVVGHCA